MLINFKFSLNFQLTVKHRGGENKENCQLMIFFSDLTPNSYAKHKRSRRMYFDHLREFTL